MLGTGPFNLFNLLTIFLPPTYKSWGCRGFSPTPQALPVIPLTDTAVTMDAVASRPTPTSAAAVLASLLSPVPGLHPISQVPANLATVFFDRVDQCFLCSASSRRAQFYSCLAYIMMPTSTLDSLVPTRSYPYMHYPHGFTQSV